MRSSFVVVVALTAAAMVPTALRAQSAPRSEDLRTEIRRIVREELHRAMEQMHGDMAPVHAAPRAAANPQVVEKIDVEVQEMNDLVGQIEKEIAANEEHLRRLGIAEPRSDHHGLQGRPQGDSGALSLVLGNGELRAADGKAKVEKQPKAKARKSGKNKKPGKNENKASGDQPVELRLDGMQLRVEGDGDGMKRMVPGQPGQAAGCDCGCPCCGAGKAKTGQSRTFLFGGPQRGVSIEGKAGAGARTGDDDDDDGEQPHKVAPAPASRGGKAGLRVLRIGRLLV